MKRVAVDESSNASKRAKTEDFEPSLERSITDIASAGSNGTGYLSGTVIMAWPLTSKMRFNFQTTEDSTLYRFDVEFSGNCSQYFDKLRVYSRDTLQIALRGAAIVKKPSSSGPNSYPVVLKYTEGVCIKFISREQRLADNGTVVDTWELSKCQGGNKQDDWFSTPAPPIEEPKILSESRANTSFNPPTNATTRAPDTSIGKSHRPLAHTSSENTSRIASVTETVKSGKQKILAPDHTTPATENRKISALISEPVLEIIPSSSTTAVVSNPAEKATEMAPPISRRRAKQLARKLARQQLRQKRDPEGSDVPRAVPPTDSAPPVAVAIANSPKGIQMDEPSAHRQPLDAVVTADNVVNNAGLRNATTSDHFQQIPGDPALNLIPGLKNEKGDVYSPINELIPGDRDRDRDRLWNFMGIITSRKPNQLIEQTGDWNSTLTLIDPSNYNPSELGLPYCCGFPVVSFVRYEEEFLPQGSFGDIILLRAYKVRDHNSAHNAVGYWDRLRWILFDHKTGKAHHGEQKASYKILTDNLYTNPTRSELAYLKRLAEWWDAVCKQKQKEGSIQHVDPSASVKPRRIHRLLSEASPTVAPSGFFDCTVEILYGHPNDNNVYSIYVTDYTKNPDLTPVQASWCKPALASRVLKVEMWLEANEFAKTMQPGQFYCFRNMRMRFSAGGYVEGSYREVHKLHLFDENLPEDVENPNFQALLQRKKEFEATTKDTRPSFKHQLIQEAKVEVFFSCTVEVLYIEQVGDIPYLYVTDYTFRSDLVSPPSGSDWSRGLENSVLRIMLCDGQERMVESIESGGFYSIRNLRLKESFTKEIYGRLGGEERLVDKLKVKGTTNEGLKALLQRKEQSQKTTPKEAFFGQSSEKHASITIAPRQRSLGTSTIADVLSSTVCPKEFRVVARVVDFYPLRLENCVVLHCTRCDKDIPPTQKACVNCDDMEHSYVSYLYRFFLCLQDSGGTPLRIVCDEECSLLKGLKPTDLQQDPIAAKEFSDRLAPLLGNLVEVHDGVLRNEAIAPETPMAEFLVESQSRPIPGNGSNPSRIFGLLEHKLVDD